MSPVAKAAVERALQTMETTAAGSTSRGSWRAGTLRLFGMETGEAPDPHDAGQVPSPAIRMFIDEREPFEIDGDLYHVDRLLPSARDPQEDVLVLVGHEYMRCPGRRSRRALQVRDLEALIMGDRVDIPFGPSARRFNLDRGWGGRGATLASLAGALGILRGGSNA